MHLMFYKLAAWIRDTRRTGYARPILITMGITFVLMGFYKVLDQRLFPGITQMESRITTKVRLKP